MRLFIFFRLCGEFLHIVFFPDFLRARPAVAARDKTARIQHISGLFADGNGFARQKRLVDLDGTLHDDAVGGNLIPDGKTDDVVQDDLARGNLFLHAVSDDVRRSRRNERQLFHRPFRPDFLNNAD